MLNFLLAAMLVPPPVEGDNRTAILYTVQRFLDAIAADSREDFEQILAPGGVTFRHDLRDRANPAHTVRSHSELIDEAQGEAGRYEERVGIPTVLQTPDLAHVWVPYAFYVDGERTHCGMDSFSLARRADDWVITNISYTVEAVGECERLGAPLEAE